MNPSFITLRPGVWYVALWMRALYTLWSTSNLNLTLIYFMKRSIVLLNVLILGENLEQTIFR